MTYYVDFETYGIEPRPDYPPLAVGVSIAHDDEKPHYYAFGHKEGNYCDIHHVYYVLNKILKSKEPIVFHNAKFDLDVWGNLVKNYVDLAGHTPSYTHMADFLNSQRIHDTMLLLFLYDPDSPDLTLKGSAERLLNIMPDEKNTLADWLVENQPVKDVKITRGEKGVNTYNKYIAYAPVEIVEPYANGDIHRTRELFKFLYINKNVHAKNMESDKYIQNAYNRERKLLRILLKMEEQGVRVDKEGLKQTKKELEKELLSVDRWIHKKLNIKCPTWNIQSSAQVLKALEENDLINPSKIQLTAKGNRKTDKKSLQSYIKDKQVANVLVYRSQISTLLSTFVTPWLTTAARTYHGKTSRVFPSWFQVKGSDRGARTGRLSSSPNFQNIPTEFPTLFKTGEGDDHLPIAPFKPIEMPNMRKFVKAFQDDHALVSIDWQQQELRLLAHYEADVLMREYQVNSAMDVHTHAQEMIKELTGIVYPRKIIKNVAFGLLYGMGTTKLADMSGVSYQEASEVQEAYMSILPGLPHLKKVLQERVADGVPIRTWGGRYYYCEEPRMVDGRRRSFEYKMLNTLIQGSAADCLKEAMIRYYEMKPRNHYLVLNVHDEILISLPKDDLTWGIDILKNAMEGLELDVKLLTDVKEWGARWG